MKLNTSKEIWIARIIAWVILAGISVGIIFATTFILGPSLFAIPNLDEKIAVAMYCPVQKAPPFKKALPHKPPPAQAARMGIPLKSHAITQTERPKASTMVNLPSPPSAACLASAV